VVIGDGHDATRAGVRRALEGNGFEVRAEAADATTAIRAAEEKQADLCLLGVLMPGGGLAAAREIRARRPESTIILLADTPSDAELLDSLRAGAIGYLPKDVDPARLPLTLRDACSGTPAIPRQLLGRLVEEVRRRPEGPRVRLPDKPNVELSDREWEVLELMHGDHSTAEIANRLSISPVTVRRHISSLIQKLDVADREAAVRLVEGAPGEYTPPGADSP
jgi:DNA-binding NarL/FixJ family response regulator